MPRYSRKQNAGLDALMRDDVFRHSLAIIEAEGLPGLTLDRLAGAIADETLAGIYDNRALVVALSFEKHRAANRDRQSDRRRSVLDTAQHQGLGRISTATLYSRKRAIIEGPPPAPKAPCVY